MLNIHHICVCICTYKRPEMLSRLLGVLQEQKTQEFFTYSIVIVDNDSAETARDVVDTFKHRPGNAIQYYVEPERNIALVRNKAIAHAKGDYLAFIDDDEFPDEYWLLNLYRACRTYSAAGILGPVKPDFEIKPPDWVIKGKLCERKSFKTGTFFENAKYTKTGNVMLDRTILNGNERPFDPQFKTGGEDVDFFARMMKQGYRFAWCEEACVYETVTAERLKRVYYLKRAFLRGSHNARHRSLISFDTLRSLVAVVLYTVALPFLLFLGHHFFMDYLIKNCDHLGKLLAYCSIRPVKERNFYALSAPDDVSFVELNHLCSGSKSNLVIVLRFSPTLIITA
ncbi:MAG: glycosyltransferase family 2 protein [Flavisolibacter sp.]